MPRVGVRKCRYANRRWSAGNRNEAMESGATPPTESNGIEIKSHRRRSTPTGGARAQALEHAVDPSATASLPPPARSLDALHPPRKDAKSSARPQLASPRPNHLRPPRPLTTNALHAHQGEHVQTTRRASLWITLARDSLRITRCVPRVPPMAVPKNFGAHRAASGFSCRSTQGGTRSNTRG